MCSAGQPQAGGPERQQPQAGFRRWPSASSQAVAWNPAWVTVSTHVSGASMRARASRGSQLTAWEVFFKRAPS